MNTVGNIPAARMAMIKSSMLCLACGILTWLPIIGVPFALPALWLSYSTRKQEQRLWNPARPHRVAGLVCAAFGALFWSVVDTILIYHALNRFMDS